MNFMDVHVDWLSVSIPITRLLSQDFSKGGFMIMAPEGTREYKIAKWMHRQTKGMSIGKGRAPFSKTYHHKENGWTYFFSDTLPYSLLEITGTGCHVMQQFGGLIPMLRDWHDRITRIDIACDFATDVTPEAFAAMRDTKRFQSGAIMKSEQGETVYVGSRKSDRYARVYKYAPPHPRSGLLRTEMVCKAEKAQSAARGILDDGLPSVTAALGDVFRWSHPLWNLDEDVSPSDISAPRDAHQGNTERWLLTQVSAALEKLYNAGSHDFVVYWLGQQCDKYLRPKEDL